MEGKVKVFIVGCGRSGTSLLRSMLNYHRDIFIPTESLFLVDYLKYERLLGIETVKRMILNEPQLKLWFKGKENIINKNYNNVRDIISDLHTIEMKKTGAKFWGQKTPRFIRYAALFKNTFPDIKFIIVVRDPRAVANSFISSIAHNSSLYYSMDRWVNDNIKGLELQEKYPADTMIVKYENLVTDPKNELVSICSFLNIPFDQNMSNYYKKGNTEYSDLAKQTFKDLNKPPVKENILKWKNSLSHRQISFIENHCKELMNYFGYSRVTSDNEQSRIEYLKLILFSYSEWLRIILVYFFKWPDEFFRLIGRKFYFSWLAKSLAPFKF